MLIVCAIIGLVGHGGSARHGPHLYNIKLL